MYTKRGIDYRPIECYYDDNTKILISKHGLRGYAILQLILNKIYFENGYYLKWNEDVQSLFALEVKASNLVIKQCVDFFIERNIFDKEMYDKFSILTSIEIQQEYARVTYKRVNQWHTKQYVYSSILSEQNDSKLSQNDSNQGNIDNGNNTEKRTAKQSNSESENQKESESNRESENDLTTPAVLLSQKLNKELKNPNLKIDTNEINLDALCNAVLESDFLQKAPNLNVDWLVKHYKDVIGGKYKNIEVNSNKNTAIIHQRQYTKEEMNNVFSNIDDWI